MSTFTFVSVKLIHMSCGECGIQFAMDEDKYNRCHDKGEGWYCPNGHSRIFTQSENKRLKERITELENTAGYLRRAKENLHNQLTEQTHKTRAEKAAKTRIKNRIKHGVCPCCNRTFKQLAEHMKTQHPEYIQN